MLTNVAETSIACFHNFVEPTSSHGQRARILSVIRQGRDYSLSELSALTNIEKSTMSARVNELRADGQLVKAPRRKCSRTGITVIPSKLPSIQLELL